MFWFAIFTLLRLKLNIKQLHLSRAYLTLPIVSYNIYSLLKSKKKLHENDDSQSRSTNLMLSFFISDTLLFIFNNISSKSLYLHHLFCTISYLISYYSGTPKIYTLVSIPELMTCGVLIKNKVYRDIFYLFIILFRLPFWITVGKQVEKLNNNLKVKYNSLVGYPIMTLLDIYWGLQIINNYLPLIKILKK